VLCTVTKNALQALRGQASAQLRIEAGQDPAGTNSPARPWMRFVDNGPGIPPDVLARLTQEPITTRAESGGNGMGLMFCQRVMQAAGGAIHIESQVGYGTTVTLSFKPAT
jgi:two-component system response regulator PhcR